MFNEIKRTKRQGAQLDWIMGEIRKVAIGNLPMQQIKEEIEKELK